MDLLNLCGKYFYRFYLRYSTATELYMIEPWEKITMHVLFAAIFIFFWYFNYSIIVSGISQFRDLVHTEN